MRHLEILIEKLEIVLTRLSLYGPQSKLIEVAEGNLIHFIPVSDILYCQEISINPGLPNQQSALDFCLTDGRKITIENITLAEYEKALSVFFFAKISPVHIINLKHVYTYNRRKGKITLAFSSMLNQGRNYASFSIPKDYRPGLERMYKAVIIEWHAGV